MLYHNPVNLNGMLSWEVRPSLQALSIISSTLKDDWCIVGGFAATVHRAARINMLLGSDWRVTRDVDVLLNYRSSPVITVSATEKLYNLGYRPVNTTPEGPQVRWEIKTGQFSGSHIDVVIPSGSRVTRKDAAGRDILTSPGAQAVLDRSEWQRIYAFNEYYDIKIATLFSCIVSKSAALTTGESDDSRHLKDLETFQKILVSSDIPNGITKNERKYLNLGSQRAYTRGYAELGEWLSEVLKSVGK